MVEVVGGFPDADVVRSGRRVTFELAGVGYDDRDSKWILVGVDNESNGDGCLVFYGS